MGTFSIWHWLIVLVVVLLVFGTKKLRNLGSDLGGAVNADSFNLSGSANAICLRNVERRIWLENPIILVLISPVL